MYHVRIQVIAPPYPVRGHEAGYSPIIQTVPVFIICVNLQVHERFSRAVFPGYQIYLVAPPGYFSESPDRSPWYVVIIIDWV